MNELAVYKESYKQLEKSNKKLRSERYAFASELEYKYKKKLEEKEKANNELLKAVDYHRTSSNNKDGYISHLESLLEFFIGVDNSKNGG